MQSCSCAFEDYIGPCQDVIVINTILDPGSTYYWRITDKFMKIYQGEAIATPDGKLNIPCTELPDGFFTAYSGSFTIEILDGKCKPINIFLASEYPSILLTINGGNITKNEIGCEIPCMVALEA